MEKALDYLRSIQQPDGCIWDFATSSWAVMAIAAAGEDPNEWKVDDGPSIVDYLIENRDMLNLSKASDVERFILSMTAADKDPRNINGTNYVEILKGLFHNGQIGTEEWLFDDFWGVLALISAGEAANSTEIQETVNFIKEHQNADGGWGWAVGVGSDVDDTAAAIMALTAAGENPQAEEIQEALEYLKENQQPDGGFPSWGVTNSASDSWAIGAICSVGQDPYEWKVNDTSVMDHLLSLQNEDGSFNWTRNDPSWVNKALMTSYAIVALCLRQYPVNGLPIYIRIEGSEETVWRGKVFVAASIIVDDAGNEHYFTEPTALGALDKAAEIGGFNYKVQQTSWGLYLYSVAGESAAGSKGWLYRVNYIMPWVGADNFILNVTSPPSPPHKELLFYYGEWTYLPLRITVDKTEVRIGEKITVFVEYFNDTSLEWYPIENATVHFNCRLYSTNATGYAVITNCIGGRVWAEKEGFIRSDTITIRLLIEGPYWYRMFEVRYWILPLKHRAIRLLE
ncbi:terpene cyclase/mutase family protein [Candidatus Bathyarchaeota archaeon]|nr:terpene cyclase/mutase family protein [Candidatus Bathyarchaeota archaeon]